MKQFHPVRDLGVGVITMGNQIIGTGLQTISQLNTGLATTALSFFNTVPAPPAPPTPPALGLPNPFGGQQMNIAPTGATEEDFDVVE